LAASPSSAVIAVGAATCAPMSASAPNREPGYRPRITAPAAEPKSDELRHQADLSHSWPIAGAAAETVNSHSPGAGSNGCCTTESGYPTWCVCRLAVRGRIGAAPTVTADPVLPVAPVCWLDLKQPHNTALPLRTDVQTGKQAPGGVRSKNEPSGRSANQGAPRMALASSSWPRKASVSAADCRSRISLFWLSLDLPTGDVTAI